MFEILITLIVGTVAGFVVGVGVLASQDFPKIAEFLKKRPVIGWTLAGLLGTGAVSAILVILEMAALLVLSFMVGGK